MKILDALTFFIENPYSKIHLREFGRRLKISVNSASRFLGIFLREGFIVEESVANLRYFKANLDSVSFREIKKVFSVYSIEKTKILESLKEVSSNCVLFGSHAKGKSDKDSDYDFLIISKDKKRVREIFSVKEKEFKGEISLHIFNFLEWEKEKKNNKAFYQDVISSGINLIGEMPI